MNRDEPRVYTPHEAADLLKLNVQTVLKYIREGKLKASKLGRVYRITAHDLEQLLRDTQTRQP